MTPSIKQQVVRFDVPEQQHDNSGYYFVPLKRLFEWKRGAGIGLID